MGRGQLRSWHLLCVNSSTDGASPQQVDCLAVALCTCTVRRHEDTGSGPSSCWAKGKALQREGALSKLEANCQMIVKYEKKNQSQEKRN